MSLVKKHFQENGFVIIPNAISVALADLIKSELQNPNEHSGYIGALKRHVVSASSENKLDPKFRFKDLYVNCASARNAIFENSIIDCLVNLTAGEPVLAFQSLGFIRGSGLRIHRDSNYVAMQELNSDFFGCWIALEDVEEGAGELIYYPKSHLLPAYHFAENSKHWVVSRDGIYANEACHSWLERQMTEYGIAPQKFLAKKGDCIIWHSDLIHAGSVTEDPNKTRYSLITHFCQLNSHPRYFSDKKHSSVVRVSEHCSFSSAHYTLKEINSAECLNDKILPPDLEQENEIAYTA